MFIPYRTDAPVRHTPIVNYVLVGLNVLMFMLTDVVGGLLGSSFGHTWKQSLMLHAESPHVYQFITYQFLHEHAWHLAGNLLFLWVFGNSVNSKMGQLTYLLFYLSGGVFAGLGFSLTSPNMLLGASGAIAAVTTAFLVLFPQSEVRVLFLFIVINTWHIPATLLIVVKVILWDNILAPGMDAASGQSQVAHSAHLAGYLYGFVLSLIMLALRALPRDQYDILALWKRVYQRHQMRTALADPNAQAKAMYGRVAVPVSEATGRPLEARPVEAMDEATRIRLSISEYLNRLEFPEAAQAFESLVAKYPDQCLPKNQMLTIANQLMTMQRYPQAAGAYEKYLKYYAGGKEAEQARLVLGIVYARYLEQYETAERHLKESVRRLTNPQEVEQATHWLDIAKAALQRQQPSTA